MRSLHSSKSAQLTGSALLLTLVILSVAGTMILVAASSFIGATRLASNQDSAGVARRLALSGLEEGMLRYKGWIAGSNNSSYGLDSNGEYGTTTSSPNYTLIPNRRGFVSCTPINTLLSDDANSQAPTPNYNPDCGYYDLAVRRIVSITLTGTESSFNYTNREIPFANPSISEILTVLNAPNPFNLIPHFAAASGGLLDVKYCFGGNNCTIIHDAVSGASIRIPANVNSLTLTAKNAPLSTPGITFTGNANLTIDKGFTTIDTTGYYGGIQKKMLITIRQVDGNLATPSQGSRSEVDFASQFSPLGIAP